MPINSVDFHPDGSCIATGGAAAARKVDTTNILIWNTAPIWDATAVPAPPTHLSCHDGSVNCVRWSNSGSYLASAGDDAVVVIWQRCGAVYTRRVTLAKHKEVILHVAWRDDDQLLVSASVDHTLIIWRVAGGSSLGGNQVLSVLRGHEDVVNGCAWLADNSVVSQSADLSLRVWDISGTQLRVITKPFEDGSATTLFQRLAVSRDKKLILGVHALNNKGPTVQNIDAKSLTPTTDFVGFRKAVVVVVSYLHSQLHELITSN